MPPTTDDRQCYERAFQEAMPCSFCGSSDYGAVVVGPSIGTNIICICDACIAGAVTALSDIMRARKKT